MIIWLNNSLSLGLDILSYSLQVSFFDGWLRLKQNVPTEFSSMFIRGRKTQNMIVLNVSLNDTEFLLR